MYYIVFDRCGTLRFLVRFSLFLCQTYMGDSWCALPARETRYCRDKQRFSFLSFLERNSIVAS